MTYRPNPDDQPTLRVAPVVLQNVARWAWRRCGLLRDRVARSRRGLFELGGMVSLAAAGWMVHPVAGVLVVAGACFNAAYGPESKKGG